MLVGGPRIYGERRPGDARATLADLTETRAVLGWEPQIDTEPQSESWFANQAAERNRRRARTVAGGPHACRSFPGQRSYFLLVIGGHRLEESEPHRLSDSKSRELKYMWFKQLRRVSQTLHRSGGIKALFNWPVFSITSFEMVTALARQGVSPNSIIDVGANIGQFTVAAAKKFPHAHIYSFEPLPDCALRLRRNVRRLHNVFVYGLALGAEEGRCAMHVNAYTLSSSLLSLAPAHQRAFPYATEAGMAEVAISTLDKMFEGIDLPRPVLLKIDVQGYEARVLRGAANLLKRIDHAVIEASLKPMYEGETLFDGLEALMRECGFRFDCPVGSLKEPSTGEILQIDALFNRIH